MDNTILISVICGVYNAERTIGKMLSKLISQKYENIEIILCINGTTDSSEKIIDGYMDKDTRIKKIFVKEALGAGGARQRAFEEARGMYIAVIDCDDYVEKNYLQEMITAVKKYEYPDIVFSGFCRIDNVEKKSYTRIYQSANEALYQSVAPWGKIFKADYLKRNRIDFKDVPFGEDILFTAEIILSKPQIVLIENTDYCWVNNMQSASHTVIRNFPTQNMRISEEYFSRIIRKYYAQEKLLIFLMYKYYIWYLLHSGRNTGVRRMGKEYNKVIKCMNKYFGSWENKCLLTVNNIHCDRKIVIKVIKFSLILRLLRLDRAMFCLYSVLPMEKLWPNL